MLSKKDENDNFHEGWKVESSNSTPIKFLSVDYNLKILSFEFGNAILIGLEIQRYYYQHAEAHGEN